MASAALSGRFGTLRVSTATTTVGSQAKLAELRNYTITAEADTNEVTSHDSSGWREILTGTRRWSWEAEVVYLSTGTGQAALRASFSSASPNLFNATFQQTSSTGSKRWHGKTYLTGWTANHDTNDAVLGTLRGEGHGPLNRTA